MPSPTPDALAAKAHRRTPLPPPSLDVPPPAITGHKRQGPLEGI